MLNYEEFFRILFTEYFVELFVKSGLSYLINTNPVFRPYSKNLKARHDRLQEQYMIVKNDIDAKRLKEVAESLTIKQVGDKYFAKVLATIEDFRYEGEGQRNCVLSYVSRVVKSEIVIIAIRKRENLEKTFVTVELKRDRIVQAKGFANSSVEPETLDYLSELALKNNWRITSKL